MNAPVSSYRFSGHETFVCRYAWLSKGIAAVAETPSLLTTAAEDDAMVELGVGKNMVRSIRFWAECTDMIRPTRNGHEITELGENLFLSRGNEEGFDPYLEDIQTLWLLHWKLATNPKQLIFAWNFLLNHFQEPELYTSTVVRAFKKQKSQHFDRVSDGSLEQLWDVFLHSYVPTRGRKGEVREDNLDCPLVELDLLRPIGLTESSLHPGRHETKYAFRREDKQEISQSLFAFCLHEYWQNRYADENSITFQTVVTGEGSPGQVFKIPEYDIRSRLLGIEDTTKGHFVFEESASVPRVVRIKDVSAPTVAEFYILENAK